MEKMPKVIAVLVGIASIGVLGQAPALSAQPPVDHAKIARFDTGWG